MAPGGCRAVDQAPTLVTRSAIGVAPRVSTSLTCFAISYVAVAQTVKIGLGVWPGV